MDDGGGVQYFDHDFEWDDIAKERFDICQGETAPKVVDGETKEELTKEESLAEKWEVFYQKHTNRFFKTRSYLVHAFPVLQECISNPERKYRIYELGCGTGAALIPLLQTIANLNAMGCDVSSTAIDTLQSHIKENEELHGRCVGAVCDIARDPLPIGCEDRFDFSMMTFTLSAINPSRHLDIIKKGIEMLKPGGYFLFRDYGLYDMVQTRCKVRLDDNRYIKQDGIQCFFFSIEYFTEIISQIKGAKIDQIKYCTVRNINHKKQQNIDRVFLNAIVQRCP